MNESAASGLLLRRFGRWFLSAPALIKIMGTGLMVALVFGGMTVYLVRANLEYSLMRILEERALCPSRCLAADVGKYVATSDMISVGEQLARAAEEHDGVRYVIIEDRRGRVLAHTFEKNVPADLVGQRSSPAAGGEALEVYDTAEGLIFEAAVPILEGSGGTLRLGMSDQMVRKELSGLTGILLLTLGLCMVIGMGLALALTYVQTRPVRNLLGATNRVAEGDFQARAKVYWDDEIGRLAEAFNRMTSVLEESRQELLRKERARLDLVEKTVLAQEKERKSIARDLHDHLGQSLSVLLMEIQSLSRGKGGSENRIAALESRVSGLIDEVRHLAWGMHPSILEDYGLEKALARYAEEVSLVSEIEVDYQNSSSDDLGRLPMGTEVALYRIAQEAINNILRHAEARHASIVLLRRREFIVLLIEDDGIGFDPGEVGRDGRGHIGLLGMRERATLLGGEFAVESIRGKGATIRVRIPQRSEEPCPSGS